MSPLPLFRFLLVLSIAAFATAAQAEPGYLVEDVPAQASGANTVEARDTALLKGQRDALQSLFERLAPGDRSRLPTVSDQLVFQTMQGFEVKDERTTGTTYAAKLTVEFRRAAIDSILGGQGVASVVEPQKPALLLPLLIRSDGSAMLWSEENGWQTAWANRPPGGDSQRLVVPLGDLQDIQQLPADMVVNGDLQAMNGMARSYECDGIYVATARQTTLDRGQPGILVEIARPGNPPLFRGDFAADPSGDYGVAFETAATAAGTAIQQAFREQNAVPAGPPQHLEATARFSDLRTWRKLRQTLEDTAAIQRLVVKRLAVGSADLALDYRGDPATLIRMLASRGLILAPGAGGWEVSAGGGGPARAAPGPAAPAYPQPPGYDQGAPGGDPGYYDGPKGYGAPPGDDGPAGYGGGPDAAPYPYRDPPPVVPPDRDDPGYYGYGVGRPGWN